MAKTINPEDAGKWTDDEYSFNVKYLRVRGRNDEAEKVKAARAKAGKSTKLKNESTTESTGPSQVRHFKFGEGGEPDKDTVDSILEWVGDDEERAQRAYDHENSKLEDDRRSSLLDALEGKFDFGE